MLFVRQIQVGTHHFMYSLNIERHVAFRDAGQDLDFYLKHESHRKNISIVCLVSLFSCLTDPCDPAMWFHHSVCQSRTNQCLILRAGVPYPQELLHVEHCCLGHTSVLELCCNDVETVMAPSRWLVKESSMH